MNPLPRLEGVRQSGAGRWLARCPAHDDRSPSLSLRRCDDGRWLVHCFAGCEVEDVLAAVGLTFADLFPPRLDGHRHRPAHFPARDLLALAAREALAVAIAAEAQVAGEALSEADRLRLRQAATRLREAASHA